MQSAGLWTFTDNPGLDGRRSHEKERPQSLRARRIEIPDTMDVNEKIALRREELGLSDVEVARATGITIHSYCDIEWYPDELCQVVPLEAVKRLCSKLRLNLLDLLEIPCAFCKLAAKFDEAYSLPSNELIRHRREKHGWSLDELGERVNYLGVEINHLEADPDYIENWRIDDLKQLSKALEVPLQILLGVHCENCGPLTGTVDASDASPFQTCARIDCRILPPGVTAGGGR